MIPQPDLIHYACIAKGATVLAEFNSKDAAAALGATAAKCLVKTPPFHATFTHTVRSKTHTFLIDQPFVYFVISDEKMENAEGLAFLNSVKDAFRDVYKGDKKLQKLSSHCFQGEINPIFHQLLGPGLYHVDEFGSPGGRRRGESESGVVQCGSGEIRVRAKQNGEKGLKKMVNRLIGEYVTGRRDWEKEGDEDGGKGIGLSREFLMRKNGEGEGELCSAELMGGRKTENVWRKQMWVVLLLDLIVCTMLFAVWLWVCSGFKCMNS
ncbi:hypothetical protein BUALT_Bualt06G0090600 [Buddleja alternifolia]|uniref:Longin domain-containing protein n=1 Tax=Buddleja alternifolia TaxID=168488 RepID=A0AAV6XKJ6_9LAMI|nr:hypothetical protein BUALT_Bualt06G0090600 [Buddleja alternifolia]